MQDWRDGLSLARITWQDELGEEHVCEDRLLVERVDGQLVVSARRQVRSPLPRLGSRVMETSLSRSLGHSDERVLDRSSSPSW